MLALKSGSGPLPRSGPEDNDDETELLARVAAGEAQAFRGLVDRHLPTVLAIARRIVELHGGQFGIQSEPGAGTTVTVKLPATPSSA